MTITRRSILKASAGAGVMSAVGWDSALAQAGTRTRYGAGTPQGKQMLTKYARAVGLMMDNNRYPKSDARSWDFQWYTHWIPGPQTPWSAVVTAKNNMINQVFAGKPPNDPGRLLAQAMWDACQAHGNNTNDPNFFQETYFCVWHRWYLYYFEEIIRGVLQDQTFTLPYWNYLSGAVQDLSIPPEFRVQGSPLFRQNRNPWVNAGDRIDKNNPGVLNLNCFNETIYINAPTGGVGFCPLLDQNPHGQVHVLVGNQTNMGRIPFAAGDPVFWLHHCNIDRLWESWNRLPGRTNPAWPDRPFPFADANGKAVSVLPKNASRVAQLKYQYDAYYVPKKVVPMPAPVASLTAGAAISVTRATATGEVALANARVDVPLQPAASPTAAAPTQQKTFGLSAPSRRLYLVIGGITAAEDDDSTYNVFLDLPEGQTDAPTTDPHYVGTLNFFNAAGHEDHAAAGHNTTFNVTDTVKALQGKLTATPKVTLVRIGDAKGATPKIRQVYLVEN